MKFFNEDEKVEDTEEYDEKQDDIENFANALVGSELLPTYHKNRKQVLGKGIISHKHRGRGIHDIDRSAWWKPIDQYGSSQKQIKKWIEINDIRYGIKQQRER